jgi:ribosomal protein S15P/S13E
LQLAAGEIVLVPGSSTSSTTQQCGDGVGSGPGGTSGVVGVDVVDVGSGMRDWALLTTVIWAIDRHLLQNKKQEKKARSLASPKRSRRLSSGERAKQKLAPKMRSRVVDY